MPQLLNNLFQRSHKYKPLKPGHCPISPSVCLPLILAMNLITTKGPQLPVQYLGDLIMELRFTLLKFIPNIQTMYFSLKITYKSCESIFMWYIGDYSFKNPWQCYWKSTHWYNCLVFYIKVMIIGGTNIPRRQDPKVKKLNPVLCHTIFISLKYRNTLLDQLWEIMCR